MNIYKCNKCTKNNRNIEERNVLFCSPVYDYIYQFSEYVFAVETNRKVGFMNIKGEIIIPIEYDSLSCRNDKYYKFSNGRAKVVKCLDAFEGDEMNMWNID